MQRQMEEIRRPWRKRNLQRLPEAGRWKITVSGKREVTKVHIEPEAVDPEDVEMLGGSDYGRG